MENTIPPKPDPKKVYKWGMLYETIDDYFYVAPGSKESQIFKVGWRGLHTPNLKHPLHRLKIQRVLKQQEECLRRKEIDWERLSKTFIDI